MADLDDGCFAEGKWWWMARPYRAAEAWCQKHATGEWGIEIDAAAFTFKNRDDFDRFRKAFPREGTRP